MIESGSRNLIKRFPNLVGGNRGISPVLTYLYFKQKQVSCANFHPMNLKLRLLKFPLRYSFRNKKISIPQGMWVVTKDGA